MFLSALFGEKGKKPICGGSPVLPKHHVQMAGGKAAGFAVKAFCAVWLSVLCLPAEVLAAAGQERIPAAVQSAKLSMMQTVRYNSGKPQTSAVTVYMKDGRLRIERQGMALVFDGRKLYSFHTKGGNKTALELPPNRVGAAGAVSPLDVVNRMLAYGGGGQELGRGTIAGRACRIVKIIDLKSKSAGRAWIDLSTALPLRIEMSGKTGAVELSTVSIQLNPALPDALFTLPKGYSVMRLPKQTAKTAQKAG
jgi:outer membrane lipoprotein-sorting protein